MAAPLLQPALRKDGDLSGLILTFTGRDAPGITAQLSRVLAQAGARLVDVEQVVVQGLLTLGFAVEVADEDATLREVLCNARSPGRTLAYRKAAPGPNED